MGKHTKTLDLIRSNMELRKKKINVIHLDENAYSKFIQFGATTNPKFLDDHEIKYDIIDDWESLPISKRRKKDVIENNDIPDEGQAIDAENDDADVFIHDNLFIILAKQSKLSVCCPNQKWLLTVFCVKSHEDF